jgi:hypothetical protein
VLVLIALFTSEEWIRQVQRTVPDESQPSLVTLAALSDLVL